jgi:GNAT superfamily N-acetyltransferase
MTDLIYAVPTIEEAIELGRFCTKCIDNSYGTRTCSDETAHKILEVTTSQISSGLVEKIVNPKTNDLIGFYAFKVPTEDTVSIELGNLFVHPDHHHQGIGTRLFQKAISKAKSLNHQRMFWVSDPGAEKFYLKCGASITGHDHNILNPAVPVPLFEIKIPL